MGAYRAAMALWIIGGLLAACRAPEPAPAPAPPPTTAAPQADRAPPVVAQTAQPAPAPPVTPVFVYDPTGLRDPFEPFIKLEDKKSPAPKAFVPKTPLQRFPTEELKLAAIIWGEGVKPRALIEDPQGKGYVVSVGTFVGDRGGKIVRIQPDQVVVEERFTDLFGEEKVNVANMTLHRSESGVSP